jgi:hypothetical protein
MFTISRSGTSIASVIAQIRDVPARVIPYATSTALTRTALAGRAEVLAEMRRVFDRPTPYALNSTRVIPSTVQTLSARVQVNDDFTNNGVAAEDFLFPEVFGGPRKEKRYERSLRYSGILRSGEYTMPGQAAPLDAYGNLRASEIQRILTAVRGNFDPYQNKTSSRRSRKNAKQAPYFAGAVRGTRGIWKRQGRRALPILIFTTKAPVYRTRLDFEGIVKRVAETQFEAEFYKAADAIVARRGG